MNGAQKLMMIGVLPCLLMVSFSAAVSQEDNRDSRGRRLPTMKEIIAKIEAETRVQDGFIEAFWQQDPEKRIQMWMAGPPKEANRDGLASPRMRELIVRRCPECAPYLARILRNPQSPNGLRSLLVEVLCEMDRFVPAEQVLLGRGGERYKEKLETRGEFNPVMMVDGRRIGSEAYAAVMWAAEQTENSRLRFEARDLSGLLERDLRRLSLAEQISQWRVAVTKEKDSLWWSEAGQTKLRLGPIIASQAPESLPPLIRVIQEDKNGYVREEAIFLLKLIDENRMRLRATELGLSALDAVRKALEKCDIKPEFNNRKDCREGWDWVSVGAFEDQQMIRNLGLIGIAMHAFHGVEEFNPELREPGEAGNRRWASILRPFIEYLNAVDPYYPSWEYSPVFFQEEIFQPKFRDRVARFYEQWKRFKAGEPPKRSL